MRLYIIRHADPDYPNKTITERGHKEAEALAARLERSERPDRIFCSPLGRAVDTMRYTAERIGRDATIEDWTQEMPLPALETPDWGRIAVWDVPGEVIRGRDPLPSRDDWHTLPHYGPTTAREQFAALQQGSDAFLARHGYVREGGRYRCESPSDERIAVFCHAGFGIAWLAHLLEIPLPLAWSGFWLAPSSVTTVLMERRSDDWAVPRCVAMGDVSHLYAAGLEVSPRGILATNW
ncbi:MAG TPA: histidine phosphatase family protein [Armatimonadaceae bacterium]|nr:histidine phosphatase family protein [Armatimonadaceae bacterium]